MKFKNLLLASLAVCAFASCTNDNDDIKIADYKDFDAHLSLTAIPSGTVITKASSVAPGEDEKGTVGEQFVQTLTAYVFNESDGKYAGHKTVTSENDESIDQIDQILVKVKAEKAGDVSTESSFKVVLLANVSPKDIPTNLSDLAYFEGIENYSFEGVNKADAPKKQYLPMASSVLTVTKLVAGSAYNNWVKPSGSAIQYTTNEDMTLTLPNGGNSVADVTPGTKYEADVADRIALTRHVARIQLESLNSDFSNGNENATFTLKKVHLANVSNASKYIDDNGIQYVLGSDAGAGAYNQTNAFMRGEFDFTRADYYLANGDKLPSLTKTYGENEIVINNNAPITFNDATMAQFYAFEFDGYGIKKDGEGETGTNTIYTSLILEGTWMNHGINETRYFRIPIKHETDKSGIKRNFIYKLSATLTGEGTDNPDKNTLNSFVSFSIKIVDWKVITQIEDDVN